MLFITLLIFGCGSFEDDPKPVDSSEEIVNINIGKVIRSGEFEQRVETEVLPQNNCDGKSPFSFSVSRQRTLEQSIDVTFQGEGGGELELAGKPLEVGVAGKIIAAIGAEYGQSNSKSISDSGGMEFTIDPGIFPNYIIVWREKWERGFVTVQQNGQELKIPYLYLTSARPEVIDVEYKDCLTGESLQEQAQETEDTPTPTNTPLPTATLTPIPLSTATPTPVPLPTATPTPATPVSEFTVYANISWQDTNVYVDPENIVDIEYVWGTWTLARDRPSTHPWVDANGYIPERPEWASGDHMKPLPGVPYGTLVGRIDSGEPFKIGQQLTFTPERAGNLFLVANDHETARGDNDGSILVRIIVNSDIK